MNTRVLGILGIILILVLFLTGFIQANLIYSRNATPAPSPITFPQFNASFPASSIPVISPIGNRTVSEGELLEFQVNATDPEGRGLTYYASTLPEGASFDPRSRVFDWTPSGTGFGTFGVIFTVFNGVTVAQERVLITVRPSHARVSRRETELMSLIESYRFVPALQNGVPAEYNHSTLYYVGPPGSIQSVIDGAHDGDVIVVSPGLYRGNLNIDKSVVLLGDGSPVLDAGGRGSAVSLTIGGVVIDGFTINNSGSGLYDSGIKVSSNRNVIRNNTITGNQYGINFIPSSAHNEVFHNNIYNNTRDGIIGVNMQEGTVISSNQILNNGDSGLDVDISSSLRIVGNLIGFNGGRGIVLNRSIMNSLEGNTIQDNGNEGINLRKGGRNTLENNVLRNNLESGVMIGDSFDPDLTGNQITRWTSSDFLTSVEGNVFSSNHGPGLSLDHVTAFVDTNAFQNNQFGIKMTRSIASVTRNTLNGNSLGIFLLNSDNSSIAENTVWENQIGIFVEGISANNLFEMNLARENSISGILLEPDTRKNFLRENTATNNTEVGLGNYGQNYLLNNLVVFNGRNEVYSLQ